MIETSKFSLFNYSSDLNLEELLLTLEDSKNLLEIKDKIKRIIYSLTLNDSNNLDITINNKHINRKSLLKKLEKIVETITIEKALHYIRVLRDSFYKVKTNDINDIDLNNWKKYKDIITDSLWIFEKRATSGSHNAKYWGNFIPQIPNQLLRRYTKKGEWILDPFLGSGTSLIECKRLGRNGIGVELSPEAIELSKKNIDSEPNIYNVTSEIIYGDSTELNFKEELKKRNISSVQFIIMHPPYWDIIKFSKNKKDLSNAKSIEEFLSLFGKVIDNTFEILEKERYLAVVIGDKYSQGEWIPLGFYAMSEVLKRNYTLKSIIVKNFEQTKGKINTQKLWRYRALKDGFYVFKHEYIFLFKKNF